MASTADDEEVAEAIDALLEDEHMEAMADAYEDEDFESRDEIPDDELDKFLLEYNGEDVHDDSPPATTEPVASQVKIYCFVYWEMFSILSFCTITKSFVQVS